MKAKFLGELLRLYGKLMERETLATISAVLLVIYESKLIKEGGNIYMLIGGMLTFLGLIIGRSYVKGQEVKAKALKEAVKNPS